MDQPTEEARSIRLLRAWRAVWPPALVVLALMITALPTTGHWGLAGALVALLMWRGEGEHGALLTRYLAGFLALVAVRALADDVGMPVRLDYPIALDRALFGMVPTVVWQAHRALWKDALATGIYLSYFLLPRPPWCCAGVAGQIGSHGTLPPRCCSSPPPPWCTSSSQPLPPGLPRLRGDFPPSLRSPSRCSANGTPSMRWARESRGTW